MSTPTKRRKLRRVLLTVTAVVISLWVVWFSGVWIYGNSLSQDGPADAMIVLGSQIKKDGEPNTVLLSRLNTALERYKREPLLIICCGAQGWDEPAPEGQVMRDWLIARGAAEDMVLAETESVNTYENLENAKALLPEGTGQVLIVTSDYHLPRALWIAEDKGISAKGLGSPVLFLRRIKSHTREALSWAKYFLMKITGKV